MKETTYQDYPWELYDLDYEGFEADVLLYRGLLRGRARAVLELACGTGRILIPLARDGHRVTGLELVSGMLQVSRAKIATEGPEVRSRIDLRVGDMRDFDLGRRFDVVLLPRKTCLLLGSDEEYACTFERVHAHLEPGGLFLLDAFRPHEAVFALFDGRWIERYERVRPGTGERVIRSQRVVHDAARRGIESRHRWVIVGADGAERVRSLDLRKHYVEPEELRPMLETAGFEVEEAWGSYEKGGMDGAPVLDPHYPAWVESTALFCCRRG
ncbi:MAG: hypothetical protein CME06_16205 [Gemmatimonadetes bacterium]|nr:hypothetical protein [Gemmatimonadota bacterium]